MSGKCKPNIEKLGVEANFKLISFKCYSGSGDTKSKCGLFDETYSNEWTTTQTFYWYDMSDHLEIEIFDNCNIWRTGNTMYSQHTAKLQILKFDKEQNKYINVTDSINQTVTNKNCDT